MNPTTKVNFPNLDIFRFIAAMMVVVAHAYQGWHDWVGLPGFMSNGTYTELSTPGRHIQSFIYNLSLGVDVFFVISGFLITYLLLNEKAVAGKINIKNFYVRRALRILPLYYLAILIAPLLIYWLKPMFEQPNYLANIFYVNNFHTMITGKWEYPFAHFWSLAVEEQFYLVWPWVLVLIPTKRMPTILIGIIAISILYRAYAFYFIHDYKLPVYLNTISNSDVLAIGALLAYRHFHKPIVPNWKPIVRFTIYAVFVFLLFNVDIFDQKTLTEVLFKKYIFILLATFWMGNYILNPNAFFVFKKRNFLHYFGKISYGIYVYHNLFIPIIFSKFLLPKGLPNMYLYLFLMFGGTLLLSILSYEFFEKRFLRLKAKFEVIRTQHPIS